jgi:hypothetical protein
MFGFGPKQSKKSRTEITEKNILLTRMLHQQLQLKALLVEFSDSSIDVENTLSHVAEQ